MITLNPAAVKALFATATTQADYLLGLYRLVHPEFDRIIEFHDYPQCSEQTWKEICGLCRTFDEKLNEQRPILKQIFPGGAWLNSGFSCAHDEAKALPLWAVLPASKVTIKEEAA
jgi:hypothetical protein